MNEKCHDLLKIFQKDSYIFFVILCVEKNNNNDDRYRNCKVSSNAAYY